MEPEGSIIVFLSLSLVLHTCTEPDEYNPHPPYIFNPVTYDLNAPQVT